MQNGEGKLAPANSSSASCFSPSQAVSRASTVPPTVQPSLPISTPSSSNAECGSSTQIISALVSALQTHLDGVVKPPQNSADWTQEEVMLSKQNAAKFTARLAADHYDALYPDVDTPFSDATDVVNRLLPYHVFQHPREDLDALLRAGQRTRKGKEKASTGDLSNEIAEAKFMVQSLKRRKVLQARFRKARVKPGTRAAPDDQSIILAQAMLESERAANSLLNSELRSARADLDKIEREKRLAAYPPRPAYYITHPIQPQFYRPYPYTFSQPYGAPSHQPQQRLATAPSTAPRPIPPAPTYAPPSGPVPVQLPVTSLPVLANLGIVPVPVASLPPPDQPQPAAVLLGTNPNGTTLSMQINVSLLQPGQMTGLAVILSTLMRGGSAEQPNATAQS